MIPNSLTRASRAAALLCTGLVASALAVSCNDAAPQRIQDEATVNRNGTASLGTASLGTASLGTGDAGTSEAAAPGTTPKGRSFTDPAPLPPQPEAVELTEEQSELAEQIPYLNPALAAGLREDPGQTAKGSIDGLITFGDLSLLGADIDELLDYIYKPETERAKRFKFPDKVIERAGKDKAVVGYMIAMDYKPRTSEVTSFMLVRDLQSCCFGGVPRPDEWMMVEMAGDKTTEYHMYVPIIVRGEFTPGRQPDEYDYSVAIYNMTAESVERYEPPAEVKR